MPPPPTCLITSMAGFAMRTISLSYFFVFFLVGAPLFLQAEDDAQRAKDAIVVRALLRLPGVDFSAKPEAKAALLRHLKTVKGSEQYWELVEKFKLREASEELLRLAVEQSDSTLGVNAAGT